VGGSILRGSLRSHLRMTRAGRVEKMYECSLGRARFFLGLAGATFGQLLHSGGIAGDQRFLFRTAPSFDSTLGVVRVPKIVETFRPDENDRSTRGCIADKLCVVMLIHAGLNVLVGGRTHIIALVRATQHVGPSAHGSFHAKSTDRVILRCERSEPRRIKVILRCERSEPRRSSIPTVRDGVILRCERSEPRRITTPPPSS